MGYITVLQKCKTFDGYCNSILEFKRVQACFLKRSKNINIIRASMLRES